MKYLSLPRQKAYVLGTVPIKKAKLNDIGKIQLYIPIEHPPWYETLKYWPSGDHENEEEELF